MNENLTYKVHILWYTINKRVNDPTEEYLRACGGNPGIHASRLVGQK